MNKKIQGVLSFILILIVFSLSTIIYLDRINKIENGKMIVQKRSE